MNRNLHQTAKDGSQSDDQLWYVMDKTHHFPFQTMNICVENDGFCVENAGMFWRPASSKVFTLYKNDGFCIKNDEVCIQTDELCVVESIEAKDGQLDHEVKEYGANFSQGEKQVRNGSIGWREIASLTDSNANRLPQVICLARALLRQVCFQTTLFPIEKRSIFWLKCRIVLRQPRILVMDEATSSVDCEYWFTYAKQ